MTNTKRLRRKIDGDIYACIAIKETKEGAIKIKDAQKYAGFKARIFKVRENMANKYGVYSTGY